MAELRLQTTGAGVIAASEFTLGELEEVVKDKGIAWLDILKPDEVVKEFLESIEIDELAIEDIFERIPSVTTLPTCDRRLQGAAEIGIAVQILRRQRLLKEEDI